VCTVYAYHKIFNNGRTDEISKKCKNAEIGCVECKKLLADILLEKLSPIHERRKKYENDPELIEGILAEGQKKASQFAKKTMAEVKHAMGLV